MKFYVGFYAYKIVTTEKLVTKKAVQKKSQLCSLYKLPAVKCIFLF